MYMVKFAIPGLSLWSIARSLAEYYTPNIVKVFVGSLNTMVTRVWLVTPTYTSVLRPM